MKDFFWRNFNLIIEQRFKTFHSKSSRRSALKKTVFVHRKNPNFLKNVQ